jgi:beta-lactamase regulating signal transducer with metallopeptidase domain
MHGMTLALAWFLMLNAALSAAVSAAARHAGRSSSRLLAMRLLPATASAAFVLGVFVPSYWRFEPRDVTEGFDLTLTILAAVAAAILIGAFARGAMAWWQTARRARAWTATAARLATGGIGIPMFRIEAAQPVLALVGILRPRLILTRGLIDALTAEELAASLAHEIGHHHARDNLQRLAMIGAPDVLRWLPGARHLERQWAAAAEHRADAAAADANGRSARLALASALVKVARRMPAPAPLTEPISTLVGGGEIASRVRWLIDDGPRPRQGRLHRLRWAAIVVVMAVPIALAYAPLLAAVHNATEVLVNSLP